MEIMSFEDGDDVGDDDGDDDDVQFEGVFNMYGGLHCYFLH